MGNFIYAAENPILTRQAAPAPEAPLVVEDEAPASPNNQIALIHDDLCFAWARWVKNLKHYTPPVQQNILARMMPPSGGRPAPRDPPASAECAALHLAILAQPQDAADRLAFEIYYYYQPKNIKAVAHYLQLSRSQFYRQRDTFRQRVVSASQIILSYHLMEGAAITARARA
jgi:hypothetical protein